MNDIRDYIRLSESASKINTIFSNPEDFKKSYLTINPNEEEAFLRHFIVNNMPFVFKDLPILYEQLAQYLSDKLQIAATEIKLIVALKQVFQ